MNRRNVVCAAVGLAFIAAGVNHFVRPRMYEAIVPPGFGDPAVLVGISGIAEIAGGLGMLVPATRTSAAYGLVALLLAVWPANVYMALDAQRFARIAPAWALWARVPLQIPLMAAVLAGRKPKER